MLIDIFNDRYEHIGTEEKKIAHTEGLWHRTFSCLVVNPTRQTILLQKKAPGRFAFERPDYADFTVGGHYHAGEDIPDGVREAREELGLDVTYSDFISLGIRQTAVTLAPRWIEREFQHWHLLPYDGELDGIPLDDAEVSGLVELDLHGAISLAAGDQRQASARFLIRDGQSYRLEDGTLTTADFIPGYLAIDRLYLRMFIAARRFVQGEHQQLFW